MKTIVIILILIFRNINKILKNVYYFQEGSNDFI